MLDEHERTSYRPSILDMSIFSYHCLLHWTFLIVNRHISTSLTKDDTVWPIPFIEDGINVPIIPGPPPSEGMT